MLSLNNLLYWDTNKCFESIWGLSAAIGWWTHLWITALGHCSCAFFTAFLYLSCSSWMNTDTAEMEQCDQGTLIWKHSCPTGWCDVVLWKEKKPSNASCVLKCLPFFSPGRRISKPFQTHWWLNYLITGDYHKHISSSIFSTYVSKRTAVSQSEQFANTQKKNYYKNEWLKMTALKRGYYKGKLNLDKWNTMVF